ncbi:hypothetical protein EDB83DRAFT_2511639 [Lactarius deliciosus]|nr:hypothetical protein EDB83DRAFT_2511639 [Lactarius deliciosus]
MHENASLPGTVRTPYEPFTAFASRTNPSMLLAAAPRLDERDNPLAVLYNGILSFVERDVKRIVDIAECISARIGQRTDVVNDEASVKFLPMWWGRPEEFRKLLMIGETLKIFSRAWTAVPPGPVEGNPSESTRRRWAIASMLSVSPMLVPVFVGEEAPTEHGQAEDALQSTEYLSWLVRPHSPALLADRIHLDPPVSCHVKQTSTIGTELLCPGSWVLGPVRAFFGLEWTASLKDELMQSFAEEVLEAVVQKYIIYVTAMPKKESLRKLKKGNNQVTILSLRMVLDVEAFGKDAETLGVDVQGSVSFKSLLEMAIAPLNDGEISVRPSNN